MRPKELNEIEYWMKSGIIVSNQEISEQSKNIPSGLSIDDEFNLCVILAMKKKLKDS